MTLLLRALRGRVVIVVVHELLVAWGLRAVGYWESSIAQGDRQA